MKELKEIVLDGVWYREVAPEGDVTTKKLKPMDPRKFRADYMFGQAVLRYDNSIILIFNQDGTMFRCDLNDKDLETFVADKNGKIKLDHGDSDD